MENLADDADQWRVHVFHAQPVVTGIAFYALIAIDGRALDHRVDVNRSHRAHVRAVSAGNTFIGIDFHR
jgi:hypothetical protein